MFCTDENFGTEDEIITASRMTPVDGGLEFIDTVPGGRIPGQSPGNPST